MPTVYIQSETADRLAEEILIAATRAVDPDGLRVRSDVDFSKAPEAVMRALNTVLGQPPAWAFSEEWPRPEQMRRRPDPFDIVEENPDDPGV